MNGVMLEQQLHNTKKRKYFEKARQISQAKRADKA